MTQAEPPVPSTRPYLIRALYEWCSDNGYSPYIAVHVDASVQVPMEFVRNGEIVLNVSMEATKDLRLDNEYITFKARFGGVSREIVVPITHVIAIYARENGQGMAFPAPTPSQVRPVQAPDHALIQGAMVGAAGSAKMLPWRISAMSFSDVTTITYSGMMKKSADRTRKT